MLDARKRCVVVRAVLCVHLLCIARIEAQSPFNLTQDCFSQLGERSEDVLYELGDLLNKARSLPMSQAGEALKTWQQYCLDNGGHKSKPCSQYTIKNNSNLITTTTALAWDCLPKACRKPENREVYEFVDRVQQRNFQQEIVVVCMNEDTALPEVPSVPSVPNPPPPDDDDEQPLFTEDNMKKAYEVMTYVFASLFGVSATGATVLGVKVRKQHLMIKDSRRRLLLQNVEHPLQERSHDVRDPLRRDNVSYHSLPNRDNNGDDDAGMELHLSDISDDEL